MAKRQMFRKVISILPRQKLESLVDSSKRPWMWSRKQLEESIVRDDSPEIRETIMDYLRLAITGEI